MGLLLRAGAPSHHIGVKDDPLHLPQPSYRQLRLLVPVCVTGMGHLTALGLDLVAARENLAFYN